MSRRGTAGTPRSAAGRVLAAAAAAALVASLGLADETRGGADPSARVRFDHRRHDAWTGDCASCHRYAPPDAIPGAEAPAPEFDRPGEEDCTRCHEFERPPPGAEPREPPPAACAMCHPVDGDGRVALPMVAPVVRRLAFDHRRHDESSGAGCRTCHEAAQADSRRPPGMRTCLSCHVDALAEGCARCHLSDARGLLVTDLPDGGTLVPPEWMGEIAHGPGFDRAHGEVGRAQRDLCARCHEETFCQGCHVGTATERRFHEAGWFSSHGPASRSNDLDCGTCHRGQESCLACHRRAGVTWDSPEIGRGVPRGTSFHDGAWRTDHELHALEARRSLDSCVSCHSERDCATCHSSGPSPHGGDFESRCGSLAAESPGVCLQCHATVPDCR